MFCTICGPLIACDCPGGINGIGSTFASPFGSSDPSRNAGLGAGYNAQQQANLASQFAAAQLASQNSLYNAFSPGGVASQSSSPRWVAASGGQISTTGYSRPAPAEPQAPLEKAGTAFGEFIGWRIWNLKDGYLSSYSAQYAWMPGHPVHGEVSDNGYGGIWAFKEPHHALHKAMEGNYVVGSVWLWGEVVEHTMGYRAEYAAVRSIEHMTHNQETEAGWRLRPQKRQGWRQWREKRQFKLAAKEILADLRELYAIPSDAS